MAESTRRKKGTFWDFTPIENAAICLKAMVLEAGGTVIIAQEDLQAITGTLDIHQMENGDYKVTILAPGE